MSYTYQKTNIETLMPEGDYEAKIENAELKTLPTGTQKLMITYRIRQDVEQMFKNKVMWEDIWREKANPEVFNRKRINQLLGTQDLEEGTVFNSIDDIIKFLKGKNLIVHVVETFDEYDQKKKNIVAWYKSSKVESMPEPEPEYKEEVVQDDDLPF
jgi:hypothetical protein